jgi:uncharacterized protein (DUF433 family)
MSTNGHPYLEHRAGSRYRQLYVKGRKIRAEVLYRQTIGEEPRTPEEVAQDYDLPVEAVLDAINYCKFHPDVLAADRRQESTDLAEYQRTYPPLRPPAS